MPIEFRHALILVSLSCLLACSAGASAASSRPNVLVIICDDLNPSLGAYGNQQVQTPNLDRLAKAGVRFTRAYAQWPSCLPSRFSFLSGWSPVTTEVTSFDFTSRQGPLEKAVYLPQHFKTNGYFAARLDKVFHIGKDDPASWNLSEEPIKNDDDEFVAVSTGDEIPALGLKDKVLEEGRYRDRTRGEGGFYQVLSPEVKDAQLFDGRNAARAVELLERFAGSEQPFFLAVGFRRPHLPWLAPQPYFDRYPPESIALPVPDQDPPIDEQAHREMISHYYAATTFADAQVGKVMEALKRLELDENTIIVLFGDHGYCLGEKGNMFGKGNLWERSLLTPLVIVRPGNERAGAECDAPVELLDLYPTLVELCGLPEPDVKLEGASLVPLLNGNDTDWRGHATAFNYNKDLNGLDRTVRTDRYRYTEKADGTPEAFIDYANDPYGRKNLVEDEAQRENMERLRQLLARRMAQLEAHGR